MLVAIWALNNFTAHRLLHVYYERLLNLYYYQSISNLKKLLKQKSGENIAKIDIPVFLIIKIYIGPIKFLENNTSTIKYNLKKKLYKRSKNINQGDNQEIE